jgi:hypothetical protein
MKGQLPDTVVVSAKDGQILVEIRLRNGDEMATSPQSRTGWLCGEQGQFGRKTETTNHSSKVLQHVSSGPQQESVAAR